jgi:hypothetical protein
MHPEQLLLLVVVLAVFGWRMRRLVKAVRYYLARYRYHRSQRLAATVSAPSTAPNGLTSHPSAEDLAGS